MNYTIVDAQPLKGYRLLLRFSDGLAGQVNVSRLVGKGVFKAWKKPGFFEKVYLDLGTVCWPGNLDMAPDALYQRVLKQQQRKKATRNTFRKLAYSKFIGIWKDRPDIGDDFAQRLRSEAWKRSVQGKINNYGIEK